MYLCAGQAKDSRTHGSFQISAVWEKLKPGDQLWASEGHWSAYDVSGAGRKTARFPYAGASDKSGWLNFHCSQGAGAAADTVLTLNTMSFLLARNGTEDQAPELIVRLMHPVAVKLAKELGCLSESRLPGTLGKLTPLPPKSD